MPDTTTALRRAAPLAAALLAALLVIATAAPAHAADSDREDYTFGTTHEGMDMGRDPATGDEYMRASPPEQPRDQQQPVEIHPEIRPKVVLPGHDRHQGRGHDGDGDEDHWRGDRDHRDDGRWDDHHDGDRN